MIVRVVRHNWLFLVYDMQDRMIAATAVGPLVARMGSLTSAKFRCNVAGGVLEIEERVL